MIVKFLIRENREENYKRRRNLIGKNTSHSPSQSIDETSAGNGKIFMRVECVTNHFFFDMKLEDEKSSIADNGSGSPLLYRVFLPTFVQLPTEMPFGAGPVPQIEVAKIFFHSMATEATERGHHFRFLVLESHISSVPSKNNRHIRQNICHGKVKLQWCCLRSGRPNQTTWGPANSSLLPDSSSKPLFVCPHFVIRPILRAFNRLNPFMLKSKFQFYFITIPGLLLSFGVASIS